MHLRDSGTAQVMRRASTGPHALMLRRALAPYVPDRGSSFTGMPARSARTQYFGAVSTTQSIASGASRGAAVGNAIPIVGTAVGAILGAVVGWADAAFNRQDPEVQNFDQAQAMSRANGPESVVNIQNKYLVLAGLFDLEPKQIKGNIPIYKKYGKMGEQRFVTDMINLVYQAGQSGQIYANDNAQTVFARIVQPWIDGFGFGAMSDSNQDMINYILMGLLAEYFANLQHRWYARGGDYPFGGLPPFSLGGAAVAPTSSATPSPTVAAAQPPPGPSELQSYMNGAQPEAGTKINYVRDSNGKFMAIPVGGVMVGRAADGSWIVQYATGPYVLSGSQLVPYQAPSSGVLTPPLISQPAPATQLGPPAGTPVIAAPQSSPQIQYMPSGGGGGGGYYPPQYAPAQPVGVASAPGIFGLSTNEELVLGIGGALVLLLFLKKRRGPVGAAV
jgi:hypothetical protein